MTLHLSGLGKGASNIEPQEPTAVFSPASYPGMDGPLALTAESSGYVNVLQYSVTIPETLKSITVVGEKKDASHLWGRNSEQMPYAVWYIDGEGNEDGEGWEGTVTDDERNADTCTVRLEFGEGIVGASVYLNVSYNSTAFTYNIVFSHE